MTTSIQPLPRRCLGHQSISVTTGAVVDLTIPNNAATADIQADGASVSLTQDGITAPSATLGKRIDDGVIVYVDTPLEKVKLIARSATTKVQVTYYDKA